MELLTDEALIMAGGWHPRYARVLLIQYIDAEALALVDGNGNGAEVECEQWSWTSEGWVERSSNGIGPLDGRAPWTWGELADIGFVVGCAEPGTTVMVKWGTETQEAIANDNGVWVGLFDERPATSSRPTLVF
jgi:hypothetical protein